MAKKKSKSVSKKPMRKPVKKAAKKATKKKAAGGKVVKQTLSNAASSVASKLAKKVVSTIENLSSAQDSLAKSMVGATVPKFKVPATGIGDTSLADFSGRRIVLYFYPKDSTPGCTLEGYDFKRLKQDFDNEKAVILGVSKDSMKSHENFKTKCGFPFELLVDQEEKLCKAFDVIQMKSLYGRRYLGIERSTFVIDETGKVRREWRKVKVNGHAEEVLDFLRTL